MIKYKQTNSIMQNFVNNNDYDNNLIYNELNLNALPQSSFRYLNYDKRV